jgi:Ser/Thr protein kinase RdoA (MazF antagonist)
LSIEAIVGCASRVIGPCEFEEDRSWEHRASVVLRLRDAGGGRWVVKRHRERGRYAAELAAYQEWVPGMGECAPRLRGHDDEGQLLVLSALSGEPAWPGDVASHRRAGGALRLLHEAEPGVAWDDFQMAKLAEFEDLAPRASQALPVDVVDFVLTRILALAELEKAPVRVPCHRDYTPRNWLVDGERLYVLDFEFARPDVWVSDLARLDSGAWRGRPELRAAFLEGYGRVPDAEDEVMYGACAALTAIWLVVTGRECGRPALEGENRRILGEFMKRRR